MPRLLVLVGLQVRQIDPAWASLLVQVEGGKHRDRGVVHLVPGFGRDGGLECVDDWERICGSRPRALRTEA